jgi:endonuclease/exonuclease/phosphatase family metal-dependent hydrolase
MKKTIYIALFFTLVFQSCSTDSKDSINLMTYNIRLDYPKTGENTWDLRKDFLINQILTNDIDILGIQEGMPDQLSYMDSIMTDYNFVGVGRDDGKNEGEYSAIFYNTEKYQILEQNTFWLSETPDTPTLGWDAACKRICTYALIREAKSANHFWVFNTHFDHVGEVAKQKSADLIIDKIKNLNSQNFPVVLMGDFNLEEDSKEILLISSYLSDSKMSSKSQSKETAGTYNAFDITKSDYPRIDYIFVSDKTLEVDNYRVIKDTYNNKFPSDHFPVCVDLTIKNDE